VFEKGHTVLILPQTNLDHPFIVDLVRTDVSNEDVASIFRVERISELGSLAITNNEAQYRINIRSQRASVAITDNIVPSALTISTLKMDLIRSSETKTQTVPHLRRPHSSV
jgi:hypothetical protein